MTADMEKGRLRVLAEKNIDRKGLEKYGTAADIDRKRY